jgi:integrase
MDRLVRLTVAEAGRKRGGTCTRPCATYADFGLVFAKEPGDLQTPHAQLGQPMNTFDRQRYVRLIKASGVKRITFHGLRHTSATLMLSDWTPVHVVAQRLGNTDVDDPQRLHHALPDQQATAAAKLGKLLHGQQFS